MRDALQRAINAVEIRDHLLIAGREVGLPAEEVGRLYGLHRGANPTLLDLAMGLAAVSGLSIGPPAPGESDEQFKSRLRPLVACQMGEAFRIYTRLLIYGDRFPERPFPTVGPVEL